MTFHRRRLLAALAAAPAVASITSLTGCASASTSGSYLGHKVPVKPAGFRLGAVQVRWQESPAYGYSVIYARSKYAVDTTMTKAEGERAKAYMTKLLSLYRENSVAMSTDRLVNAGAQFGATHTITLMPLKGRFNHTGWSCGMTMRVSVLDANRQVLYTIDIDSDSGWHMSGLVIPDPDASFVNNFSEAMVSMFKQAGLLA